ncbi:hypothetical protein STVA_01940 [Allostella vacuolata]|nr:hypothetical protein STVA_01940 [Stella vacuolata]
MIRRFRIVLLAGLCALLAVAAGGYSWFWHRVAAEIVAGVPAWTAGMAAQGIRVTHGPLAVSGFPFQFRLEVPQPVFARDRAYPAATWSGDRLLAIARPWRLREWALEVPRPSRLDLVAGPDRWQATVARVDGALRVDPRDGELLLDARGIAGVDADPLSIAALRLRLAGDPGRPRATAVALAADSVRLPARARAPLGREIARVSAEGAVVESIPSLPPAAALESWRQAGGTIDVERFRVVWGQAELDGAVTVALDRELQPVAAGTAALAGHDAVLDALVESGSLGRMEAFGARAILGAVAAPTAGGGAPVISLQFSVQDGRMLAGPIGGSTFRLLSLPRVEWPER